MTLPMQDGSLKLWLQSLAAEVLDIDLEDLDTTKSFLALGGDSLSAIEYMGKCRDHQVWIEISDMMGASNLADLIDRIIESQPNGSDAAEKSTPQETTTSEANLQTYTPIIAVQKTQAMSVKLPDSIPAATTKLALDAVVRQHAVLQTQANRKPDSPIWLFEQVNSNNEQGDEAAAAVVKLCEKLHSEDGAAFGAVLFSLPSGKQTLVVTVPRHAVDQTSWRIIFSDFSTALHRAVESPTPTPTPTPTHLERISPPKPFFTEIEAQPHNPSLSTNTAPLDDPSSTNSSITVDDTTTDKLFRGQCHHAFRTNATDLINAALFLTAQELGLASGYTKICHISNGRHGHASVTGTVGCFDENRSFVVPPSAKAKLDPVQLVRNVKDIANRSRAHDKRLYGVTTTDSTSAHTLPESPSYSLYLNIDSTDTLQIPRSQNVDLELLPLPELATSQASNAFHVIIKVWNGKLKLSIRRNKSCTTQDNSTELEYASRTQRNIESLVYMLERTSPKATLSDFPLLDTSYSALDTLLSRLQGVAPEPLSAIKTIGSCSPMQNNFLASQRLTPQAYQCRFIVRIKPLASNPELDLNAVKMRWNQITNRHSILRTTFVESDTQFGSFDQVVWKQIDPWVVTHDRASALFDDTGSPTYSEHQPQHRFSIAPAPEGGVFVKLDISHALFDGQSTEVIMRDFCYAYLNSLPEVEALPYLDFTEYELGVDTQSTSAYWGKYMYNAEESYLPVQNNRTSADLRSMQAQMNLPAGLLSAFCGRYGVTPANVCQVAWGLVLRSFTYSDDVCFSYVTSRRQTPLSGIQDAVGLFIDVLFCRLKFDGDPLVRQVLANVGEGFVRSLPYQNITTSLARDPQRSSVRRWGNTVLSFLRVLPAREYAKAGLEFELVERSTPTDYDVSLNIDFDDDSLHMSMDYWESKMDQSLADSILGVFQETILFLLENAQKPIRAFSPLTEANRRSLQQSCQTSHVPVDDCIHNLVRVAALDQPQSPAVAAWDGNWTYEELDANSSAVSQHLLASKDVKSGEMVGICMEKSKWAIVAMLAILKCGAAVVPVGIDDPRAKELLNNANVTTVLTSSTLSGKVCAMGFRAMIVDRNIQGDMTVPFPVVTPKQVAWVLFTSGSSGKPKGVILEHLTLSTALLAQGKAFEIDSNTRILQFAAYTFADSITDIFATLVSGGCVCIPSEEDRTIDLAAVMHRLQVNQATLTSTVAGLLLDPAETPQLRRLVLSGEMPSAAVVSKWMPHTQIINGYGQSEAAVFASCSTPITNVAESSNIGKPINGRFWVVQPDDYHRLCPMGAPGELLIESPSLAKGYLNDAERSASVFVESPKFLRELDISPSLISKRMYRTGDLVRQSGKGGFIFIGRQDTQVKIRGQRVELGEIEGVMAPLLEQSTFSAVSVNLVKFAHESQAETKLVAALELDAQLNRSASDGEPRPLGPTELPAGFRAKLEGLQNTLLKKLPVHMVPALFVPMNKLPVNTSSKTDRRAIHRLLETMQAEDVRKLTLVDATNQQPSTEIERKLQSLWAVAFNRPVESISIKEHFFQAGGDSVTAVRMVAAARTIGVTLTVAQIFKYTRIVELAEALEHGGRHDVDEGDPLPFSLWSDKEDLSAISIQCGVDKEQIEDVYPCTPLQEGLMAITTQRPQADAYVLQRAYHVNSMVSVQKIKVIWEKLVACTPILRTRIALTRSGKAVQVVVQTIDQVNEFDGITLSTYLEEDRKALIHYGQPPSRAALLTDGDKKYFVWTIHHSVYDGWSTLKILDLFAKLWVAEEPPKACVPMARFIRYLSSQDQQAARDFWSRHLDGATKSRFPILPDYTYAPLATKKAERSISFATNPERKSAITTATLLRATWAILLASYSGEQEAVMSVTLSGRNAPVEDIVELMAPTLTSVPFRIPVPKWQPINDLLKEVQIRTTSMIPFEHTGLQHIRRLVKNLGADFDPGHVFTIQTVPISNEKQERQILFDDLQRIGSDLDGLQSYALTMDCIIDPRKGAITLEARFDDAILSNCQVDCILGQFDRILCQLSEFSELSTSQDNEPVRVVGDLNLVGPDDLIHIRRLRDHESKQRTNVQGKEKLLHQIFESNVRLQPETTAVSACDGDLTYYELDRAASRLAQHLMEEGVEADSIVGLCMSKSKYAIVAILATLKAGGAVLPLDTMDSMVRILKILDDAKLHRRFAPASSPIIILTDEEQTHRLAKLKGATYQVVVNEETLAKLQPVVEPLLAVVQSHNIALITYTSGPVMNRFDPRTVTLEHSSLVSAMYANLPLCDGGKSTRTLQYAPFVSGTAIQDIFTTFGVGGCLCVPSERDRAFDLAKFIKNFDINTATLSPTVVEILNPHDVSTLKTINFTNEAALKAKTSSKWREHASLRCTYNLSICGITCAFSEPWDTSQSTSNIGFPTFPGSFWVTQPGDLNKLCQPGAVGDLLVETPLLALDYMNDAALIEPAFIREEALAKETRTKQHPRVFLWTGDRVRQNSDGSFSMVARKSEQELIHIERTEVDKMLEHVISSHASVKSVTVLHITGQRYGDRSIALVVLQDFALDRENIGHSVVREISPASRQKAVRELVEIQHSVAERQVSEAMASVLWVPLAAVPQTDSSDPTDITILSQWIADLHPEVVREYAKLDQEERNNIASVDRVTSTTEQQLQHIWAEALGIPLGDVKFDYSFLALGGDSIAAIRVVTAGRDLGFTFTLRDVIQSQNIPHLAVMVRNKGGNEVNDKSDLTTSASIKVTQKDLDTLATSGIHIALEDVEDVLPCSPIQQGILLGQLRKPDSYRICQTFCVRSASKLAQRVIFEQLMEAWRQLQARHSIMRTIFVESFLDQDGFNQIILKSPQPDILVGTCPEGQNPVQYLTNMKSFEEVPGRPAHRFTILQTDQGDVFGRIETTHALVDATSFEILTQELLGLYDSMKLANDGSNYGNYITYLCQHSFEQDLRFWTSTLAEARPCLLPSPSLESCKKMPAEAINGENTSDTSSHVSSLLHDISVLQNFQRAQQVTIATVFELAWALILSIYTGSDHVCWGGLTNGRDIALEGINSMVGPMINQTIHYIPLVPNTTIGEAARDVQRRFLDAFEHQRSSLADIQHGLKQVEREMFNTLMSYRRRKVQRTVNSTTGSIVLEPISTIDPTEYDITLHVISDDTTDNIEVTLQYSSAFIEASAAQRFLRHYLEIVQDLASNPSREVQELKILSLQDLTKVRSWNQEAVLPKVEDTVHNLVRQQLRSDYHKVVVEAWDGSLTARQLDEASSSIASRLSKTSQVGPGSLVGFCMSKSKWAVVAMLGILKSGGAVVPIGVQDPIHRIDRIVQSSAMKIIVTDKEQHSYLEALADVGIEFVIMQDICNQASPSSSDFVAHDVFPSSTAFVMHTSGSTGLPKGVVVDHGSLCSSMKSWIANPHVGFGTDERILQFTSFTFDPANHEVLSGLYSGACICVPSEHDRLNNLEKFIQDFRVTTATLTPSVARLITPEQLPSLRALALMGEAVKSSDVKHWIERGSAQIVNAYGPTECSIIASISPPLTTASEAPNIGYPIKGVAMWVVQPENYNYLCPVGIPGELLVEGPIVAKGYLNDESQTAASFITDPKFLRQFGSTRGRRMYRTGDLVRQNEDGSLTYVKRRDNQIKIRGQRVELGEIENAVMQQGSPELVKMVSVELLNSPHENSGEAQLIAAVQISPGVCDEKEAGLITSPNLLSSLLPRLDALRHSLLDVLPSYMVPSVLAPFSRMPLTSAGKIDKPSIRNMLYKASVVGFNIYNDSDSASSLKMSLLSPTEIKLQALWASILKKPASLIDKHDDFFKIGGDSISAMKLVADARREQPPIFLTVGSIFKHSQLSELAHVSESDTEFSSISTVIDAEPFTLFARSGAVSQAHIASLAEQCQISPESIEDVYPCSPLQEGLMAITAKRPDKYVLQQVFELNDGLELFKATWESLWSALGILRTRIVPWNTGAVQVVVREPVEWQAASSLQTYLEEDHKTPMSYGGRLCRISAMQDSETGKKHVVITMHHSIYDGWSLIKTFEMLSRLYRNDAISPPVPMSRFIRFLSEKSEDATRAFWRTHLGTVNVIKFPELPVDPSFLPQSTHYAHRPIVRRRKDVVSGSITTSNILRATWAILLASYAGMDTEETLIMVAVSGRQVPVDGILDVIGPTVATVPVRIQIPQNESVPLFLSRVQKEAAEMIDYEHTGLQNIRRHVPDLDDGLFAPAHLFTVQPALESEHSAKLWSKSNQLLKPLDRASKTGDAIQGYAFNMECTTKNDDEVDVAVWFDDSTISKLQVNRMLEQFENIYHQLSRFSNDKNRLVRDLDMISPDDHSQIVSWNKDIPGRTCQCIHEILQDIAHKQPDAPAVCAWDGDFTYSEFVATSAKLAQYLRLLDDGVGPEALLGLCMSKSKWALVAIVAILQAGGGVVPLGIGHPVARIQTIAHNTKLRFVLTDAEQSQRLISIDVPKIVIDEDFMASLPPSDPTQPPCPEVTVDNTSYVVFTSGSTGTPKGSMLEHGALASSLLKHSGMLELKSHSRALQFAAFTFDNSISDIFATFFQGGCVCEPSEEDRVSNLAKAVWDLRVNFLSLTPTVAALLRPQDVPPIEVLVVGGEPLDPNVIDIWGKSSHIINSYGPSECSILVACSRPLTERRDAPNVGLPVACCFWVVSPTDYNQLVPIGAPGELLLQGPQLGRGYINETEKTAKAFVLNPSWVKSFPTARDQRLYRSGDLVRQNPDQSLTMIGRRDTQVKIHGQRVEIGEVESWIVRLLPDVRKAAVDYIALTHGRGDRVLIAALELESTTAASRATPVQVAETSASLRQTLDKLRTDLRAVLPSYMIPSIFLPVTRLPLNPSSKLDRLALRNVFGTLSANDWNRHLFSHVVAKTVNTETETILRRLWSGIMSLDETFIGREDNIFELGGDSVVAMKLAALARDAGMQLTVADIFQNPTLEHMATAARLCSSNLMSLNPYKPFSLLAKDERSAILETTQTCSWLRTSGEEIFDIAPITDFQAMSVAGMFSASRMDLNYFGLDGDGPFSTDELRCTCQELIANIETLRTGFVRTDNRFWQVVLHRYKSEILEYRVEGEQTIQSLTQDLISQEIFGNPQDGKPPVDIAIITEENSNKHRLLFRFSHALYDAHSMPIIWTSLSNLHQGARLEPRPTFTQFLSDMVSRSADKSLAYWREFLSYSSMPQIGQQQNKATELRAAQLPPKTFQLPSTLMSGMMPSSIVKAAWGLALSEYSGLTDVLFGEASTGRNAVDPSVANAYGCCVTALPFRFVVPSGTTVSEMLQAVRDQQTKSIQHEIVGIKQILKDCVGWSRFSSLINHQRAQDLTFKLGGTEYKPHSILPTNGFYMTSDITITATQGSETLEVALSYALDVIPENLAVQLLENLQFLLEAIITKPNDAVSSILESLKTRYATEKL